MICIKIPQSRDFSFASSAATQWLVFCSQELEGGKVGRGGVCSGRKATDENFTTHLSQTEMSFHQISCIVGYVS